MYVSRWTSAAGALEGVLRALGAGAPANAAYPDEVLALSGHAFRLAIVSTPDGEIGATGPACFSAQTALPLYEGLGWRFTAIEAAPDDPHFLERRQEALDRVRTSLDRGRPAIAFGLHIPDFGIVRGYQGADLIATTTLSPQYGERLPAAQWPAPGRPSPIRVFIPEQQVKLDRRLALRALVDFVVGYAAHGDPGPTLGPPAVHGLAAFDRWVEVLLGSEVVSPEGQAYCVQALQEGRKAAAAFLRAEARRRRDLRTACTTAAQAYDTVVLELSRVATLFPFPNGGDVVSAGNRRAGAAYVRRAQAAEEQAITALTRI